jgi:hypothetical protein
MHPIFASNVGKGALGLGVSGLIYKGDMLLYDRNTDSLPSRWICISGRTSTMRWLR